LHVTGVQTCALPIFILSTVQGSMSWATFKESLLGATRLYCMIALILAGAQFLTLAMGYIGLPRALAEWIASLGLSQFGLVLALRSEERRVGKEGSSR